MHFSSVGRGKTVTKRSRDWEDRSRASGVMDPDGSDSDPDDPKSRENPVDPSELQALRPNDYIIYKYKVRFLYYIYYLAMNR